MTTSPKVSGASELSPAEVEHTTDNFHSLVHQAVSQICSHANVRSVFGDPITRDDVTVIPVASVYVGFGAGLGLGSKKDPEADASKGGGMGLGGGYVTQPLGVWEIGRTGARFRRVRQLRPIASLVDAALCMVRGNLQKIRR
jgi:uncharacterized spore protein YtfJ